MSAGASESDAPHANVARLAYAHFTGGKSRERACRGSGGGAPGLILEAPSGFEPEMEVLQCGARPPCAEVHGVLLAFLTAWVAASWPHRPEGVTPELHAR